MQRFDAQVLAYCQMGNHFHRVLHTRQGKLSRLMRHINGVYTQQFNRRRCGSIPMGCTAYFSPSWTAFQADRGRDFSGIVDDGGGAQVIF